MTRGFRSVFAVLFAILVTAALLNGFYGHFGGRRVRPEHVAAPAVFLIFVVAQISRRVPPLRLDAFFSLCVAWVAVNALSSWMYAPNPQESLVHVIRMAFLAMAFLTVANFPGSHTSDVVRLLRLWLVLGGLTIGYGLLVWSLARFGGIWLAGAEHEAGLGAISVKGTQMERNLLGILAAAMLSMITYWLAATRRSSGTIAARRFLVTLGVLSAILVVVSMTRSAWIAVFLAGPAAYVLFDRRRLGGMDRSLLVTAVAAPVALVLAFAVVGLLPAPAAATAETAAAITSGGNGVAGAGTADRQTDRSAGGSTVDSKPPRIIGDDVSNRLSTFTRLDSDFTLNTRLQDARWAIDDWRVSPWIGRGTGAFTQIHVSRAGSEAWVSNLLLHTLVDTGLVGLVIQVSLIMLVAVRGWCVAAQAHDVILGVALRGLVLGLFVMLIAYQVTDGSWMAVFWIHMGLIVNGIHRASADKA